MWMHWSLTFQSTCSQISNNLLNSEHGPPSRKQKSARKWYDQSLRALKQEISRLNKELRSSPSQHLCEQVTAKTKASKSLL